MNNSAKISSKEITPTDVLGVFLALQELDSEGGDTISNLKAQKMLYYAQGWSFAKLGKPLFNDDFEAWQYGPLIPELWRKLTKYGSSQIPPDDIDADITKFTDEQKDLVISVYKTYGQFTAWRLRDMTHEESPWKDVFDPSELHIRISKDSIKKYFSKLSAA